MEVNYGKLLRKLRQKANISVEDIAEKLGVSAQDVEDWENDISKPSAEQLVFMAKTYGVSVDDIKANKVDSVNIDEDGIHVMNKDGDEVHISSEGVTFKDKKQVKKERLIKKAELLSGNITLIVVTAIYVLLGCLLKDGTGWRNYWVLYFLVPVVPSIFTCIRTKNANYFCCFMLALGLYLGIGMIGHVWHPSWVIFLMVPVYHSFCKIFENKD